MDETRGTADPLRIRAVAHPERGDVHAIALAEAARHAVADRFNDAGAIAAGGVGKLGKPRVLPAPDVRVDGIDACRVQAHDDLTRARLALVDVGEPEHLGSSELDDPNGVHEGKYRGMGEWGMRAHPPASKVRHAFPRGSLDSTPVEV